ncbi:MAG: pteridine reductase [Gammaproteobacteria bacterium]|nr:pteridine reductase [Gammaproteobacteria bacterium]
MNSTSKNKVVLITGAARRIGAAITQKFHDHDYNVIVHCNDSLQEADQLAGQLNQSRPNSAAVVQANLTLNQDVSALVSQALQAFGRVDVVINNASTFYPTPLAEVSSADWDKLIDSNLRGAFFLCQGLADTLREHHGAIVNLLDIYAEQPLKNHPVYSIAKAGLSAMTRSLAMELAPEVRVNGVAPGAILWPAQDKGTNATMMQETILASVPLGRTGAPEDIAEAVYFLAVQASYVTGEVIRVDGGRRLNL